MSETKRLSIYTRLGPEAEAPAAGATGEAPAAEDAAREQPRKPRPPRRRTRRRASRGDRLLRNSAIACALLLGVLTLGNLDAPWARKASESVERALTMRIDLDESIGALQFVRSLMPESALVFMNLSAREAAGPVEGSVDHPWSNLQPWRVYACPEGAEARAVQGGTVTAVSPLSGGRVGLLIDHGNGAESLYASLADASVRVGDSVEAGQAVGHAGDSLYFEYRRSGESVDPATALGL